MTRNLLPNSRLCVALTVLVIAAFFVGCKNKEPQPAAPQTSATVKPPVQEQQNLAQNNAKKVVQGTPSSAASRTNAAVNPVIGLPPPPVNQFDFSNKKDPFKPFVVVKAVATPTPDDLKKALQSGLPIHSFDVSQFRLIGVVTGGKENQAMVVDPNGKGYVLKIGMTIGKNDGRITSINTSGVDVLEQFKDDNGRVRKENIRITLPRKQ